MITADLANRFLDSALRTGGPLYASLHTAEPEEDGRAEVAGDGYSRQLATFEIATDRRSANLERIEWPDMPEIVVRHIGLWDSRRGGRFLWGSDRTDPPLEVPRGAVLRVEPGFLIVTLDVT